MPGAPSTRSGAYNPLREDRKREEREKREASTARRNAHIRGDVKPASDPTMKAEQAQRLLDDPAFVDAMLAVKTEVVQQIEGLVQDGTQETTELERELCRTLRTLNGVKRALTKKTQGQTLREHNFRPRAAESEIEVGDDV